MSERLEELLERALAARAAGESTSAVLANASPDERREIEPLVLLADAFRQAPRAGLSASAAARQERMLLAMGAQRRAALAPAASTARPAPVYPSQRWNWNPLGFLSSWRVGLVPAATLFFLVVSTVLIGGFGTMVSNARPDQPLYNLKLSWEQTQILLSGNDAQRARVFIDMAQARLREVEMLARAGEPIPEELLLQVRLTVNQAIQLAANLNGREAISLLRQISELLNYERILLTRFLDSLPAPDRATVLEAIRGVEASQQTVNQALQGRVEEYVPGPTATIPISSESTPATSTSISRNWAKQPNLAAWNRPAAAAPLASQPEAAPTRQYGGLTSETGLLAAVETPIADPRAHDGSLPGWWTDPARFEQRFAYHLRKEAEAESGGKSKSNSKHADGDDGDRQRKQGKDEVAAATPTATPVVRAVAAATPTPRPAGQAAARPNPSTGGPPPGQATGEPPGLSGSDNPPPGQGGVPPGQGAEPPGQARGQSDDPNASADQGASGGDGPGKSELAPGQVGNGTGPGAAEPGGAGGGPPEQAASGSGPPGGTPVPANADPGNPGAGNAGGGGSSGEGGAGGGSSGGGGSEKKNDSSKDKSSSKDKDSSSGGKRDSNRRN